MFSREITNAFFEKALRVDTVIPIALACHDYDALADTFVEEFYDWVFDVDEGMPLFDHLPGLQEFLDQDAEDAGELAEWLYDNNFDGVLARIETPVRTYRPDGSASMGWGYLRYTWIYGATMDQMAERALAWVDREIDAWKVKGGAA